ncbi:MAG: hypothetical protein PHS82_14665 [Lachnospiraceae bacterium]|nr:hypothetical protein [Lachnospiraceae bacterium]
MKEYELIVEKTQPSCGGKSPRTYDFYEIETDDVVAYAKKREGKEVQEVFTTVDGVQVVEFVSGASTIQYQFTAI